ncbi:MAG TPA: hypothetical protein VLE44_01915 [Candidatus Saccharimonadales bacterium]|nr:hypothetical protein [Candidatus Saccharimonadales bacterium]
MKFEIASTKLTGSPDQSGWAEVHDFNSNNSRLIALVSMPDKNYLSGKISKEIEEEYLKSVSPEKTKEIVEKLYKEYPNLSVCLILFIEGTVCFSLAGQMRVWVSRKDQVAQILKEGNVSFSMGPISDADLFLVGTTTFFANLNPTALKTMNSLQNVFKGKKGTDAAVILKSTSVKSISPMREKVAGLIDKLLLLFPQRGAYLKEEFGEVKETNRKKVASTAGVILLVLLGISIFFGSKQQNLKDTRSKYEGTLLLAMHNLDEAQKISTVNGSKARELVLNAKSEADDLINQGVKDDRLTKLVIDIKNAMGQIGGIYQDEPSSYMDLGLQSSGLKGDDMAGADDRMIVLDRVGKRLVSIDYGTKRTQIVAGPDIMPNAANVAVYGDRNFATASDGVWDIGAKATKVINAEWGSSVLPYAYAGNFYILDKDAGVVWRYQGDGGVFAAKQNWFGPGIKPNLTNIVSWSFDGQIWMLTKDSQVLRFSQGSPVDFSLKGIDTTLKAIDIFTTQDSKYLYLLDTGNSRVVVIDKEGTYKAQYVSDSIKNMKKIIVSEPDKKIILLGGDKLYSLEIKHI